MRDLFFYPLLVLAIAGILMLALLPGRAKPTSMAELSQGYILKDAGLEQLTTSPGTLLSFEKSPNGRVAYAVMSANLPRKMATASAGVFGTIGPQHKSFFAGQTLKITVVARQGSVKPVGRFDVGYFTVGAQDSGWQTFDLSPEFREYSFTFTPAKTSGSGNDYFGIWPDVAGRSQSMDVQSMSVKIAIP